jgi:hypothetical protein
MSELRSKLVTLELVGGGGELVFDVVLGYLIEPAWCCC